MTYDPAGQSVIVLEGSFATHPELRALLDLVFSWPCRPTCSASDLRPFIVGRGSIKGDRCALARANADEWPAVDAQRESADLILTPAAAPRPA